MPSASFDRLADQLEHLLEAGARQQIADDLGTGRAGLMRLRREFSRDTLPGAFGGAALQGAVRELERQTQADGFHVLRDWDGRARRFVNDSVSVAMLDFAARLHEATARNSAAAAAAAAEAGATGPDWHRTVRLLVDHFALFLIALLILRAWDADAPDVALGRVEHLLRLLQSERGSGHPFVAGPESLLWIAVSNYHPDDDAYNRLVDKVRGLERARQLRFAENGAHILGTHLRWGLEAYYRRDYDLLRKDNVADYPWLLYCLATLMDRWHELSEAPEASDPAERRRIALALLNGMTADPPGFTFDLPPALAPYADERARFVERYDRHWTELQEVFRDLRPTEDAYSPLAFHFNFPHNAMKAAFAMRLAGIPLPRLPLDALFEEPAVAGAGPGELSDALVAYSRANPERIRDRQVLVLAYNLSAGLRTYRAALLARPEVSGPRS